MHTISSYPAVMTSDAIQFTHKADSISTTSHSSAIIQASTTWDHRITTCARFAELNHNWNKKLTILHAQTGRSFSVREHHYRTNDACIHISSSTRIRI